MFCGLVNMDFVLFTLIAILFQYNNMIHFQQHFSSASKSSESFWTNFHSWTSLIFNLKPKSDLSLVCRSDLIRTKRWLVGNGWMDMLREYYHARTYSARHRAVQCDLVWTCASVHIRFCVLYTRVFASNSLSPVRSAVSQLHNFMIITSDMEDWVG